MRGGGGGGVLLIMDNARIFRQKGKPFSGQRYIKGRDFISLGFKKGWLIGRKVLRVSQTKVNIATEITYFATA